MDNRILLELKAASRLYAMHRRQIQFYLCASGIQSGLLINFGNAKTIECERYEWIDSGYQVPERPHIPDVRSEKPPVHNPAVHSLAERVRQVLGTDADAGCDA